MNTQFEYYYNNVPGKGFCRNNLIYTSLISKDRKTFVQWYHNDTEYHRGMNEVVNPNLMQEKWEREVFFLNKMNKHYPEHIPNVIDIDYNNHKIFLEVENVDFWQENNCQLPYTTLPNWEEQMIEILKSHKELGIYKMSLHPSSYFVVDGKLKSINYFFSYDQYEKGFSVDTVLSHISLNRQEQLIPKLEKMGYKISDVMPLISLQQLAFESFRSNFTQTFIEKAKEIYV